MIGDKIDGNQHDVIDALESHNALAQSLAAVKRGCPDVLVGYKGSLAIFEIKPGDAKNKSDRELNENEVKWHRKWAGYPVFLILFPTQAVEVLRGFDMLGRWPDFHRSPTRNTKEQP